MRHTLVLTLAVAVLLTTPLEGARPVRVGIIVSADSRISRMFEINLQRELARLDLPVGSLSSADWIILVKAMTIRGGSGSEIGFSAAAVSFLQRVPEPGAVAAADGSIPWANALRDQTLLVVGDEFIGGVCREIAARFEKQLAALPQEQMPMQPAPRPQRPPMQETPIVEFEPPQPETPLETTVRGGWDTSTPVGVERITDLADPRPAAAPKPVSNAAGTASVGQQPVAVRASQNPAPQTPTQPVPVASAPVQTAATTAPATAVPQELSTTVKGGWDTTTPIGIERITPLNDFIPPSNAAAAAAAIEASRSAVPVVTPAPAPVAVAILPPVAAPAAVVPSPVEQAPRPEPVRQAEAMSPLSSPQPAAAEARVADAPAIADPRNTPIDVPKPAPVPAAVPAAAVLLPPVETPKVAATEELRPAPAPRVEAAPEPARVVESRPAVPIEAPPVKAAEQKPAPAVSPAVAPVPAIAASSVPAVQPAATSARRPSTPVVPPDPTNASAPRKLSVSPPPEPSMLAAVSGPTVRTTKAPAPAPLPAWAAGDKPADGSKTASKPADATTTAPRPAATSPAPVPRARVLSSNGQTAPVANLWREAEKRRAPAEQGSALPAPPLPDDGRAGQSAQKPESKDTKSKDSEKP